MKDEPTLISLFEKIIRLEEKLDSMGSKGDKTSQRFTIWAMLIAALELLNLWLHAVIKWGSR